MVSLTFLYILCYEAVVDVLFSWFNFSAELEIKPKEELEEEKHNKKREESESENGW